MFLRIVASQARYRWGVTLLIAVAMTCLVTLFVYLSNTTKFANRSMQLVMKNMGHNLLMVPKNADLLAVYQCSDNQILFPDDTTRRLAEDLSLASKYYVSVLQARVHIDGKDVLLTGIEPVSRADETPEKRNLVLPLGEDEARLGDEAARILDKRAGDEVEILGARFRVVEVLPPKAGPDDYRVYTNLSQCQRLLGKEGQIHFILAFLCLHAGSLDVALEQQQKLLRQRFPELRQVSRSDLAQGRHLARMTTRKSLLYLFGMVAAATVVVIAVTGVQEVSDRRHETGIMIAMGVSYPYLVGLYLAKTLVIALASSIAGFFLGSILAIQFTAPFLVVNTRAVTFLWWELPVAAALTCGVALVAQIVPTIKLLALDPNTILAEQ